MEGRVVPVPDTIMQKIIMIQLNDFISLLIYIYHKNKDFFLLYQPYNSQDLICRAKIKKFWNRYTVIHQIKFMHL